MFKLSASQLAELDKAVRDAVNWEVLQDTLYGLCRKYRDHANPAGSNAKLWLIGRGLATGIERQIESTGGQGSTMLALCQHVHRNQEEVDALIERLRHVREPLDAGKLQTIVEVHGRLIRVLQSVLRPGRSARSFAAK